jgi:GTP-binding protein
MTHQESALAAHAAAEGRALVIVANKLDALPLEQAQRALELVRRAAEAAVPDARGLPVLGVSALTGRGAGALLPAALAAYDTWNRRVPTSGVNRWLEGLAAQYAVGGGSDLRRIKYVAQVKARPPTFVVFITGTAPLPDASRRFLANQLRERFGFAGVPLRITVRNKTRPPRPKARKPRRHER